MIFSSVTGNPVRESGLVPKEMSGITAPRPLLLHFGFSGTNACGYSTGSALPQISERRSCFILPISWKECFDGGWWQPGIFFFSWIFAMKVPGEQCILLLAPLRTGHACMWLVDSLDSELRTLCRKELNLSSSSVEVGALLYLAGTQCSRYMENSFSKE